MRLPGSCKYTGYVDVFTTCWESYQDDLARSTMSSSYALSNNAGATILFLTIQFLFLDYWNIHIPLSNESSAFDEEFIKINTKLSLQNRRR